jgi:hypothetical protein
MMQLILVVTSSNDDHLEMAHRDATFFIKHSLDPFYENEPIDVDDMVSNVTNGLNGAVSSFMVGASYGLSDSQWQKRENTLMAVWRNLRNRDYDINCLLINIGNESSAIVREFGQKKD